MTTATKMTKVKRGDRMVCPRCDGGKCSEVAGGGMFVFRMICPPCKGTGYLARDVVPAFVDETRAYIAKLEQDLAGRRRWLALAQGYLDRRGD
jgi:hypothetical protein